MLRLLPDQPLPPAASPYEAQALQFCRDWRAGQAVFSLQTSGSTGTPKAIQLTRSQMIASARLTGRALALLPGDAALCCLNASYVAGVMMLVRGLELGLPLWVVEPTANPLLLVPEADLTALKFAAFVPIQLESILRQTPQFLPVLVGMKAILVGGAAVSASLEARIETVDAPVWGTYGMTETVSHVALRRLNGPNRAAAYRLLPGVTAGLDARGCLWVSGPMTEGRVVQTNDLAELLDSEHFIFKGRADAVVNSGGVKVQPERVEAAAENLLREAGFAGRFFATGLPDDRLGQRVVLVLEGSPFPEPQIAELDAQLAGHLGRFERPRQWLFVPQFAETPTGKVDKPATLKRLISSP